MKYYKNNIVLNIFLAVVLTSISFLMLMILVYAPLMRSITKSNSDVESTIFYTLNQVTEKTLNEVVDYDYDELIGGDRILTIKYTNANFDNTKTINHYKGLIKEGWNIFEETNDEVKLKKDNMYMYISQNKKVVEIKLAYVDTRWGAFRLNM